MKLFLIAAAFLTFTMHSYFLLRFSVSLLKYAKQGGFLSVFFPILTATVFISIYLLDFPYVAIYLIIYCFYFFMFRCLSKAPTRQIWFATSSFLLNISVIHSLALVLSSLILRLPLIEIYSNQNLFFITAVITYIFLYFVLLAAQKHLSGSKLVEISTAKVYSEIMSATSTILFLFLTFATWLLFHSVLNIPLYISIISSILFVLVMYYCLFFFNTYITVLHPYKRKADEAAKLHNQVIKKKLDTEYKLYTDDLTNLYNKRFIYYKIDELCANKQTNFALIYADLVALKTVNDTYGHKAGDRYIVSVANALQKAIREDDFSARIGGDEFVIILIDVSNSDLESVVNRIRNLIEGIDKKELFTVHANLGYKWFNIFEKTHTRESLLHMVDDLMKHDKKSFYKKGGV